MANRTVANFKCVLSDWGTARVWGGTGCFFGGTPVYAGPRCFEFISKDLFSFARLALELFVDEEGRSLKLNSIHLKLYINYLLENGFCDSITEWLYKCFYPQEDKQQLMVYRSQLSPFLKVIMKALRFELENGNTYSTPKEEKLQSICDEIIAEASSMSSISTPNYSQTSTLNTLQMEHDRLKLNLK